MNNEQALRRIGELIVNAAKMRLTENGNVDTGMLRDSITYELGSDNAGEFVVVGTNVHYAPYICFGTGSLAANGDGRQTPWRYQDTNGEWHTTSGYAPHPFLQPALDENLERIKQIISEEASQNEKLR